MSPKLSGKPLQLIKLPPTGVLLNNKSDAATLYTGVEQLNKWVVGGGSQVSHEKLAGTIDVVMD